MIVFFARRLGNVPINDDGSVNMSQFDALSSEVCRSWPTDDPVRLVNIPEDPPGTPHPRDIREYPIWFQVDLDLSLDALEGYAVIPPGQEAAYAAGVVERRERDDEYHALMQDIIWTTPAGPELLKLRHFIDGAYQEFQVPAAVIRACLRSVGEVHMDEDGDALIEDEASIDPLDTDMESFEVGMRQMIREMRRRFKRHGGKEEG